MDFPAKPAASIRQPRGKIRRNVFTLAGSAVLLLFCILLQREAGAYSSDLAGNADEPAHVVSGLMVHDYIDRLFKPAMSGWPLSPMAFAETYYVHYPKVAIGHWPPLFYLIQAIWMFAFGRTRLALLVLVLLSMAGAAALLVRLTVKTDADLTAFAVAIAFLLLPVSQEALSSVMPEALLALLSVRVRLFLRRGRAGGETSPLIGYLSGS